MYVTLNVNSGWILATVQVGSIGDSMTHDWYSPFMQDRQTRKEQERRRLEGVARNQLKLKGAWLGWVKDRISATQTVIDQFNNDMSADLRSSSNPVEWQPLRFVPQDGARFLILDAEARDSFYIRVRFDSEAFGVTVETNVYGGDPCTKAYLVTMRDAGIDVRRTDYCHDGESVDLVKEILMPAFTRATNGV